MHLLLINSSLLFIFRISSLEIGFFLYCIIEEEKGLRDLRVKLEESMGFEGLRRILLLEGGKRELELGLCR